jgi:undecaprenyl diphosphate synthase
MSTGVATEMSQFSVPQHVAIIMDGNGRWARQRNRPRTMGHAAGLEALRTIVGAGLELNIQYLTFFGFSTENWNRPADEVMFLIDLLRGYLKREVTKLHQQGVRLRFIGNRTRFDADIRALLCHAETLTASNSALNVTIALSYGGREEIVSATRQLAAAVARGDMAVEDIDEAAFEAALFTASLPAPDLLIRTSGEKRLSNFLLWQTAYTEFVFTDVFWPDFSAVDLHAAVTEFGRRERRFGAIIG